MRRFLHWLSSKLPERVISPDGEPYLTRYYICGPVHPTHTSALGRERLAWLPFTVFLHKFERPDDGRELHNHPCSAVAVILSGGYDEVRPYSSRVLTVGSVNRITPATFHRITRLHASEVWTLFAMGPRVQPWGFQCDEVFVPHKEYFTQGG